MEQWNDRGFARAWAASNTSDNAERRTLLDLLLRTTRDYLAAVDVPPRVLDVGCGPGVIAEEILREIKGVTLVGVDGSPPMLEMARERLAPFAPHVTLERMEFEEADPAAIPGGPFGIAIAVQSIHNTTDEGKRRTLASVRAVMAPGGLFLLLDRIWLATPALFPAYRSVWDHLGPQFHGQQAEGRTYEEHERTRRERGDKPGSLEQNMLWLREAGFTEVAALCVVGVRALIGAVAR